MPELKSIGKIFYGLGMAGIGSLEFIYPGFRPVLLPIPPEATQHLNFLVYLSGAVLVLAGLYIAVAKNVKTVSLCLGLLLVLFFLFGHLPNRLANNPGSIGAWTDALKILGLAGGAFVISQLYPNSDKKGIINLLEKIALVWKY